jgi:hypothetical protein
MQKTYKGCTITKTGTTTGGHDGKPLRHTFIIEGRLAKGQERPFITSFSAAREWINTQDEYAEIGGAA